MSHLLSIPTVKKMSSEDQLLYHVSAETADLFWKQFHRHIQDVRNFLSTANKDNIQEIIMTCKVIMSNMQRCK